MVVGGLQKEINDSSSLVSGRADDGDDTFRVVEDMFRGERVVFEWKV